MNNENYMDITNIRYVYKHHNIILKKKNVYIYLI